MDIDENAENLERKPFSCYKEKVPREAAGYPFQGKEIPDYVKAFQNCQLY